MGSNGHSIEKRKNKMRNRKKRSWYFIFGILLVSIITCVGLIGQIGTPYDPELMNGNEVLQSPSLNHIFGTDQFGRDVFSRVAKGIGITCYISGIATVTGCFFGVLLGGIAGYFGGILDKILMKINDILVAFPTILVALIFITLFGAGTKSLIFSLIIAFMTSFARITRSEVLEQKEKDYVKCGILMGVSPLRMLFVHIFPNIYTTILSFFFIECNRAVLAEASMSYLGLGVQPPKASLGRMIAEAQIYVFQAPWIPFFAGLFLVLLSLCPFYFSEGVKNEVGN